MTGALVAHAFASAGISTILLEASAVGRGSTGASSALLLQEPDLELKELTRRYGKQAACRIWQMSRESVHELERLLARLRIPFELKHRDAIYDATDVQAEARLRSEYDLRVRSGFRATWLGPAKLRRSTGIAARGVSTTTRVEETVSDQSISRHWLRGRASQVPRPAFVGARFQSHYAGAPPANVA
jgi:glycine/D-amino acid oxidase-like deaminating enzyme